MAIGEVDTNEDGVASSAEQELYLPEDKMLNS